MTVTVTVTEKSKNEGASLPASQCYNYDTHLARNLQLFLAAFSIIKREWLLAATCWSFIIKRASFEDSALRVAAPICTVAPLAAAERYAGAVYLWHVIVTDSVACLRSHSIIVTYLSSNAAGTYTSNLPPVTRCLASFKSSYDPPSCSRRTCHLA